MTKLPVHDIITKLPVMKPVFYTNTDIGYLGVESKDNKPYFVLNGKSSHTFTNKDDAKASLFDLYAFSLVEKHWDKISKLKPFEFSTAYGVVSYEAELVSCQFRLDGWGSPYFDVTMGGTVETAATHLKYLFITNEYMKMYHDEDSNEN